MQDEYIRPAWAEVNLDHLIHNIMQIRRITSPHVKLMAVVKCDAYGAGISGILNTLLDCDINMLGVGILDEALMIRKKNAAIPILVFGYTPFEQAELLVRNNITQTVYCKEQADALSRAAVRLRKKARIHLEIDTGMGRLGFEPTGQGVETIFAIAKLPNLEIEGIYTHCPYTNERTKEGISFTESQFRQFSGIVGQLAKRGVFIPLKHVCNSLGTVYYPTMHLDMVRAGVILYGSYPAFQDSLPLKPVLSLKARIGFIKKLGAGRNVSYGRTFVTKQDTLVATLPLGYGDGLNRMLSNKGDVLVKGQRAPVIGTICMDQCMIDISNIRGECRIGEEVVILGRQGEEEITIEEMAMKICGFINYEYMVLLHRRLPRVYKLDGKTVRVVNNLI